MNPENPTRLKEYLFLLSLAVLATIYGIFHDFITFSISPEYFEIAKGLGKGIRFFPEVLILATKASYWVGILIGVILVISNNPSAKPQLSYKMLFKFLIFIPAASIVCSVFAFLLSLMNEPYFSAGGLGLLSEPERFEMVAYIHWGTYIGAAFGTSLSVFLIWKQRKLKIPN